MHAKQIKARTTGDYSLWSVGIHRVKVSGTATALRFRHSIEEIVCEYVREVIKTAPDLEPVYCLLPGMLTSEVAERIDKALS